MMGFLRWILAEANDERSASITQDVVDLFGSESDILGSIDTHISGLKRQQMFAQLAVY